MKKLDKITLLVLKADSDTLEAVQVESRKTLSFLQKTVGGFVDVVRLGDIDIWVNDEMLLLDLPLNFYIGDSDYKRITHCVTGNVVFAAHDSEGNTVGLTRDQMRKVQRMFAGRRLLIADSF